MAVAMAPGDTSGGYGRQRRGSSVVTAAESSTTSETVPPSSSTHCSPSGTQLDGGDEAGTRHLGNYVKMRVRNLGEKDS
ncbi:hypothetical protein PIB30_082035, partial [Stylosanthes scabra]|nr:hypothetical protein [Stylosanthes scabra]